VFLLSVVVLSPNFASANNGRGKDENKNQQKIERRIEKNEKKQEKKIIKGNNICWNKFFYRMIPFGWIKNNLDSIDLDSPCSFGTPKATSTPDTIAPVISDIVTKTGQTRALIMWHTDEKTSGKIYYSLSSPVNTASSSSASVNKQILGGKDHYLLLNNLATGTTYYFVVEAKDKAGNISKSSDMSFTTKGASVVIDTTAPIISSITKSVGTSTIDVSWNTNELATSKIYYSTTTPLNKSLAGSVQNGSFLTNHSLKIEGLSTSTTYYLVVESADASANSATSSEFSLTTASGI
jgi:hypothetical protein